MKIHLSTIKYFQFNRNNQTQNQTQKGLISNPFAQIQKDTLTLSFKASSHCSTQDFQIKNLPNLYCPACGLVMLTDKQIGIFIKDVGNKKGEELKRTLEKYEDDSVITGQPSRDRTGFGIYRPYKKEVVDLYKKLALENPNLDLLGLTKLHAEKCINELIEQQLKIIDELRSYIENNYQDEEKEALFKKLDEYVKQIKGESDETFARKKFIFAMRNAVSSSKEKSEIDEITTKMPTSENDINSFFVKYAKAATSSREIASKFVNQSIPTAEHIRPKNSGGKNNLANFICDCADCNSKRGHTPFYEWLQTLPNFEERLQQYVNDIRVAIDEEKLPQEYDSYIEMIIETLANVTEGEIILEVPETTNPEKLHKILQKRAREIAIKQQKNEQLTALQQALEAEIKELEKYPFFDEVDEHREIIEEIEKVNQELDKLKNLSSSLLPPIYDLKKEISTLEDKIESAKSKNEKEAYQALYEAKSQQLSSTEEQVKQIESRLGELKRRRIALKKQKKRFFARENALKERIDYLRVLTSKIDDLRKKIEKLGNYTEKEAALREKIKTCQDIISHNESQNMEILAQEGFNPSNTKDFNAFNYQNDLLRTAENILKNKEYRKTTANSGLAREVIEIAKKAIETEIGRLAQLDTVKYFQNLAEIKSQQAQKEKYEEKLQEIVKTRQEAQSLQKQINELCDGKTEQEIQEEYKALMSEWRTISDIHALTAKREKLHHLSKTVRRNNAQFEKLKDYKTLTSAQYSQYISYIDVSDIF